MSKKILTVFIAAAMIGMIFTGCIQENNTPPVAEEIVTATAQPTIAPTPVPKVGLDAVFGKEEITIAVISNADETGSELFFYGAQKEAQSLGVNLKTITAENRFDTAVSETAQDGADAIIALLAHPPESYRSLIAASNSGLPICVFDMQKSTVPADFSQVYYNPVGEDALALNAALVYPPHDSPVRLILMFESRETQAYATFETLYAEGKIFPKEIYIAAEDEDAAPDAWLEKRLENYVEGMLDGVFAENAGLAISAVDALETLARTDMEVFGIDLTPEIFSRMGGNPDVFVQTVGPNTVLAGLLCVRASLIAMADGSYSTMELVPSLISAADLSDTYDTLADTNDSLSTLYNEDWMDSLREYYNE